MLFRSPTDWISTPHDLTLQQFNEMKKESIYFNSIDPNAPIFPHLHEQKPGPRCSRQVREDLADNNLDDSDMNEQDVKDMFKLEAHEQRFDALKDDSDLDGEDMALYLEKSDAGVEEEQDVPQNGDFSDLDENFSVFSTTVSARMLQKIVPESKMGKFVASFNKFSKTINWKAEEKSAVNFFPIKDDPGLAEFVTAIREKMGRTPHKNTVNKIYDKLNALVNRQVE